MRRSPFAVAACAAITTVVLAGCLLIDPFSPFANEPLERDVSDGGGDGGGDASACSPGSTRPCSRTTCRGEQRCNAQGEWGACDAREASFEICSTPVSESCIGDGGCTGDPTWALALGDGAGQGAHEVAVDATGNVYLSGTLEGAMPQLGIAAEGGPLDSFLAKLTPEGKVEWARLLPNVAATKLVVTKTGVTLAGDLSGAFAPAGCPMVPFSGSADVVLVRYDAEGRCVVAAGFGDVQVQTLTGLAVDRTNDDVLIVGRVSGTLSVDGTDGGVVLSTASLAGYYVRLDASLRAVHGRLIESTGRLQVNGVTASSTGAAVVFGTFSGTLLGEPADREDDGFTLIIQPNGAPSTFSTFGWPISAGAFDDSDRMLLLGTFSGTMDLSAKGGPVLQAKRPSEPFLVRRHAQALYETDAVGLDVQVVPSRVSADLAGHVLVVGDRYELSEAGAARTSDVFVAKYDEKTLTPIWSRVFGDGLAQHGLAAAADPLGSVVVAGIVRGTIDLGPGRPPLSASGPGSVNGDALVMKLAP